MNYNQKKYAGKPSWLKRPLPRGPGYEQVRQLISSSKLHTVCQEAKCPNMWECFSKKTATFMILGSKCTRNCRFCNVSSGPPEPLNRNEPLMVAQAAKDLDLKYVVVTSVTRDDLPDGGAAHFAATIKEIRKLLSPKTLVEVLIPDFQGDPAALKIVMDAEPDVLNHNIETVRSLYGTTRPQAEYHRSLELLQRASLAGRRPDDGSSISKEIPFHNFTSEDQDENSIQIYDLSIRYNDPVPGAKSSIARKSGIPVKSGIMVGLGETRKELEITFNDLIHHGCRILTIGQYLQPSKTHLPVARYYPPEEFEELKKTAESLGFKKVASGPFVRSSYQANQLFCN